MLGDSNSTVVDCLLKVSPVHVCSGDNPKAVSAKSGTVSIQSISNSTVDAVLSRLDYQRVRYYHHPQLRFLALFKYIGTTNCFLAKSTGQFQ